MDYAFHPFANVWPLLESDMRRDLLESLVASGQKQPIVLYRNTILDGRNRYLIGRELGMPLIFTPSPARNDNEAIQHMLELNNRKVRRPRSFNERVFAGARLATLLTSRPRAGRAALVGTQHDNGKERQGMPVVKAAELTDTSAVSIKRARMVIIYDRQHDTELEEEIKAGFINLTEASDRMRPRPGEKKPGPSAKLKALAVARPNEMQMLAQRSAAARVGRRTLTREQVDPDFVGSNADFIAKYGLVWSHTAAELAADRYSALATELYSVKRTLEKALKGQRGEIAKLSRPPSPRNVEWMREALDYLAPLVAEAEAWQRVAVNLAIVAADEKASRPEEASHAPAP